MRILVTWGSKHGGTEGLGLMVAEALREHGHDVVAAPVERVAELGGYGAVILGGALYANRWPASARHFAAHHERALRRVPVWLFSSGPLDASAESKVIPAPVEVAVIGERLGSQGHVTFGGRLEKDRKDFPASAMPHEHAGDWRSREHVRTWAREVASALPTARPRPPIEHRGHAALRMLGYAVAGWGLSAAAVLGIAQVASELWLLILHALLAPLAFAALAPRYFGARGSRAPLEVGVVWASVAVLLDVAVAGSSALATLTSVAGTWVPWTITVLLVWGVGAMKATMPWPAPTPATPGATKA